MFLTLSSQSSARSSIIGKDGRALDAQNIWHTLFEQLVKSDSSIGDEICRYQDVLQYASSKVDFNVGEGVYMLPSNMVLVMGNRRGFNNKILVSEHGFKIGVNKLVNFTAFKTALKEVSKVAKTTTLSYEERVLSQEHKDEMIDVSVLLIGTSLVFFYFFK